MSEPKAHEVVPQVIVKELAPEGTKQSQALQREMQKNLLKREWVAATELAANIREVDYEGFARRTAKFGVELDENGKVKKTTGGVDSEEGLVNRINNVERLTKKFFEVGFDGMGNDQQKLIDSVLLQAKRIPLLADRVEKAVLAGKGAAFAERYIKDPSFSAYLKDFLNGQLSGEFSNLVIEKWEELAQAKDEEHLAKEELKVIEAQRDQALSTLSSFKLDENGNALPDAKNAQTLQELRRTESERKHLITDLEQQLLEADGAIKQFESYMTMALQGANNPALKEIQRQMAGLLRQRGVTEDRIENGQLTTARGKGDAEVSLGKAQEKLASLQGDAEAIKEAQSAGIDISKLSEQYGALSRAATEIRGKLATQKGNQDQMLVLMDQERQAQEQVKNLEAERRRVLEEQLRKTRTTQKAEREYNAAKEIRLSEELNLTQRLEHAWGEASNAIIARQISEGTSAYGEELEDMKKQSSSAHEEAVRVNLMNRWFGNEKTIKSEGLWGKRKRDTSRPIDKTKILSDYSLLLREGDNAFMRHVFSDTINPDTGKPFEDWEINDIYDKNRELIEKLRPEATKQLIARKAMMGGFTPEDIYTLNSTEWGQRAVTQAYEQNTKFRQAIKDHFGEGALKRHGFWQRFGQEMAKHPFWWTLLLGVPAIFGTVGTEPNRDTLDMQR